MADWNELRKWDNHKERPTLLVRVASYVSMVLVAALLTGVLFWGWNMHRMSRRGFSRTHRMERIMSTEKEDINRWFWIGAAVGAVGSAGFIGYYHWRHGETHLDDHEQ